jgi:ribosome-binding factor A
METTRQKKFAKLLQKELSDIFQREMRGIIPNTMITITGVRVTPDLSIAKVYLSFLPNKAASIHIETIKDNGKNIRQELANRIRHDVRIIPNLQYFVDDTKEEAAKIDALINSLHIPPISE